MLRCGRLHLRAFYTNRNARAYPTQLSSGMISVANRLQDATIVQLKGPYSPRLEHRHGKTLGWKGRTKFAVS